MNKNSNYSTGFGFVLFWGFVLILFSGCSSTPVPTPTPEPTTPTPEPATPTPSISTPMPLKLGITFPPPNTKFAEGDKITIKGTHNLSPESNVWIFLKDIFGGYYLQNPPAELLSNGNWEATNIKLGREISYIVVIYVSPKGNESIEGWVQAKRWGRIPQQDIKALSGYRELAKVKIITPGSE